MAFEKPMVVIDNGSRFIKAGFSCDNHPVSIFRSVVGRPKYLNGTIGKDIYDVYIGDDAVARSEELELNGPISKGRVVHWDNMERIWHHIFYRELKVAPEDRSIIIGVSPTTPIEEKYKCCQILFEVLNTPAVCIQPQCVLSLYGIGCTTGITVDIGYETVDISPIYEGSLISYARMRTGLESRQVIKYIKQSLIERGLKLEKCVDETIENILKTCSYVSPNASIPLKKDQYIKKFKLPSGEVIDVSEESFAASELLFQPNLVMKTTGQDVLSLQTAIIASAMKCDAELRSELLQSIVPCGGLASLAGLNERLFMEVEQESLKAVRIQSSLEPAVLPWLGGAVFAGLESARSLWVTRQQFEENGARYVRKKFL